MLRLAIAFILTAAACHDCPPSDDEPDDSSSGSSSISDSSSGGEPVVPYGPCEVNEDCPIVPGDDGFVAPEARCFQGTCSYYCGAQNGSNVVACPGYLDYGNPGYFPFACRDNWCTVTDTLDEDDPAPCPEGMFPGDPQGMPHLDCVWEPGP